MLTLLAVLSLACRMPVLQPSGEVLTTATYLASPGSDKLNQLHGTATALSKAIQAQQTVIAQPSPVIDNHVPADAAPSEMGTISGVAFFDLDGDGLQGESEPPVSDVRICFHSSVEDNCATSAEDGTYRLEAVPQGEQSFLVTSPTSKPETAFRYISIHLGEVTIPRYTRKGITVPEQQLPKTKVQPIGEPLIVEVQAQTRLDIPLMQGYLTHVIACQDLGKLRRIQYYDHDPAIGSVINYLGDTSPLDFSTDDAPGTEDNHKATDFGSSYHSIIGTYVLAAAGGIVSFEGGYESSHGTCLVVNLVHPDLGHRTGYVHLDKILVTEGQTVQRGQILGTLGMTCTTWPHVHFYLQTDWDIENNSWEQVDPFRYVADPQAVSWWTKDNDPQCPPYAGK